MNMERRSFLRNSLLAGATLPILDFNQLWAAEHPHLEKLVILHTNDTHSRIDPFESGEHKGMGGISARKTLIDDVRKNEKNVLLLDAGDIFQGTPYFNLFHGELEMKAMAMLGYDAGTMGNHDFDEGIENFVKQQAYAGFPFIISNYDVSNTALAGHIEPYKIIKKGPIKIGILGLGIHLEGLVPKSNYEGLQFLDTLNSAKKMAEKLKFDEKCDLIIALSHLGYSYKDDWTVSDIKVAESVDHIDIILGGHTHTFLACPKVVEKNNKKFVIINQVGFGGINLGRLDIYFNKEKSIIESNASQVLKCQNK